MVQSEFGTFLSQLRKEKGLTQKQLADRLFVSDKAVSRWECGNGFPDINQLQPLSEALDVSLSELLNAKRSAEPIADNAVANDAIQSALNYSEQRIQSTRITFRLKLLLVLIGIAMLLNLTYGNVLERIVFGTRFHFTELYDIFYFSRFWMAFVALVFAGAACLHPQKRALFRLSLVGCVASVAAKLFQTATWLITYDGAFLNRIGYVNFAIFFLSTVLLIIALFKNPESASVSIQILLCVASLCVLVSAFISMISLNYYSLIDSILNSVSLASPMALLAIFLRIQSSKRICPPSDQPHASIAR